MKLIEQLLTKISDGTVEDVRVGAFWTAVAVRVHGELRAGLASTMRSDDHHRGKGHAVVEAGHLTDLPALELAGLARNDRPPATSIGIATLNALLPQQPEKWIDINAEAVIAEHGAGKNVALVGHFPFIPRLREQVGQLWVLEKQPRGDDLPADEAERVIPKADVVAITGTTLINNTFESLITLCQPSARVLVLGPSTPLSPIMFDYGIDLISGTIVEDISAVMAGVGQGANFRQIRQMGVRLVTMQK